MLLGKLKACYEVNVYFQMMDTLVIFCSKGVGCTIIVRLLVGDRILVNSRLYQLWPSIILFLPDQ